MKQQIKKMYKLRDEYYHLAAKAWEKFEIEGRYEFESDNNQEHEFVSSFCGRIDSLMHTLYSVSYALGLETERVEVQAYSLSCLLDMLNELDALYDVLQARLQNDDDTPYEERYVKLQYDDDTALNEIEAALQDCEELEQLEQLDIVKEWIAETFVYVARMQEFNLDELLEEVKTIKENIYKILA